MYSYWITAVYGGSSTFAGSASPPAIPATRNGNAIGYFRVSRADLNQERQTM